jgi:hypothetical protein
MLAKSQPALTAVWSNDCSIGRMLTVPLVLNGIPAIEYCVHILSVLIVMLEEDDAKLVAVPAWFVYV